MKYAVLGGHGQLGRDLCPRLDGEVVSFGHADGDLTKPQELRETLESLRPDHVINCAAYNFVDRAESEPEAAFAVNAWAVRNLALICRDLGATLAHLSTDYVFGLDEMRRTPWREDDAPGPVNVYGISKLAGEYVIRAICPRHVIIRTCGLYGVWGTGGKGGNFVETMLRIAAQGKPMNVVDDQVCTPTYTADLAEATAALLQTGRHGVFHLTSAGHCTWYEFAAHIFKTQERSVDLAPVTSAQFGAPARRPAYSVMKNTAAHTAGVPRLRPWRKALEAYLEERKQRAAL